MADVFERMVKRTDLDYPEMNGLTNQKLLDMLAEVRDAIADGERREVLYAREAMVTRPFLAGEGSAAVLQVVEHLANKMGDPEIVEAHLPKDKYFQMLFFVTRHPNITNLEDLCRVIAENSPTTVPEPKDLEQS